MEKRRLLVRSAAGVRRALLDALKDEPQTTGVLCERFRLLWPEAPAGA